MKFAFGLSRIAGCANKLCLKDLSCEDVVEYVGKFIDSGEQNAEKNAAVGLVRKALAAASLEAFGHLARSRDLVPDRASQAEQLDNAGVSVLLKYPAAQRRQIHDDITALVIFFRTEGQ